jgi:pyruvate formate lyase activating enzyme
MGSTRGKIFNIQHFSVHDGPGIRDVVFFKGCPLKCVWCSNPESQSFENQLAYNKARCIGCGKCIMICEKKALKFSGENGIFIDRERCTRCFKCTEECCAKAMHKFGEDITADEVIKLTVGKQQTWRADGGITLSGGEVLAQADFAEEILSKCRRMGIHTAIETSLYSSWENVKRVAKQCNLVFADMKLINSEKHKKYVGVPNEKIKENLQRLSAVFPSLDIIVRTPVIPEITDDEENILGIAEFLKGIHIKDYELLPFHNFGAPKYNQLGMEYAFETAPNTPKSEILPYNNMLRKKLGLEEK